MGASRGGDRGLLIDFGRLWAHLEVGTGVNLLIDFGS